MQKNSAHWVHYNPNPNFKDFKNGKHKKCKTSDCAVRAITKALNVSWQEAYKMLADAGIAVCDIMNSCEAIDKVMFDNGFTRISMKPERGCKRDTIESFTATHQTGVYVLNAAHHIVAVVDGHFYDVYGYFGCDEYGDDVYDSGCCAIYSYWSK